MPRFYDDISPSQKKALQALAATPNGCGYAGNIRPKVRMQTWDSLARYGLVRTEGHVPAQPGVVVSITKSGRESIGQSVEHCFHPDTCNPTKGAHGCICKCAECRAARS